MQKDTNKTYEYCCVMGNVVDHNWLKVLHSINLDENDLYKEEGLGIEYEPHVTLLYGIHDNSFYDENQIFGNVLNTLKQNNTSPNNLKIQIKGIDVFENDDYDVLFFDITPSNILTSINSNLKSSFDYTNSYTEYKPHMTICYLKKGTGAKYKRDFKKQIPIRISEIVFSRTNGNKYYKNLSSQINESGNKKNLLVMDFDDTLMKTKTNIIVRDKTTKQPIKELTSEEFAVYNLKSNEEFDFSNFNKMIKHATPISKNLNLLKSLTNNPSWRTTILTARMVGYPIAYLLRKQYGIDVYVVGLGDANPRRKSEYVERQIQKGYNNILFIDDSIKNIQAVESLKKSYNNIKITTVKAQP